MKKYDFTGKIKEYEGKILRQIVRLEDNLIGGWIEKEENLSQQGNCFVYGNAKVFDNAKIYDNARVFDNAEVFGSAEVYDNAMVYSNAMVYDNAEIFDDTMVFDDARIYGNAIVCGNAKVYNEASVYGKAIVSEGNILGEVQVEFDEVSFYQTYNSKLVTAITKDNQTLFNIGGQKLITKEEFINRIHNEDGGLEVNPHREFYLKILDLY